MQEELEQRTVSVSIQAAKLSGRVLRAAIAAVLQKMEQERTMPRVGRNSMKRLTYKDPGANTIEVSGRIRSFERYARKHQVCLLYTSGRNRPTEVRQKYRYQRSRKRKHSLSPGPDVARPLRSPICRNGGSAQKSFASVYKPGFFTKPGIMENRFVCL